MMPNSENINPEQSPRSTMKRTMLMFSHHILYNSHISLPMIIVVLSIETAQLTQLSVKRDIILFGEFTPMNIIESVIKCTTLQVAYSGNESVFFAICILNFVILLAVLAMCAKLLFSIHRSKTTGSLSSFDSFCINAINFAFFLFRTLYLFPILELLFTCFSKSLQEKLFLRLTDEFSILISIVTAFSGLIYFLFLSLCLFMLRDSNPLGKRIHQGPLSKNEVIFHFIKIGVITYRLLDCNQNYFRIFFFLMLIVYLSWTIYRVHKPNFTHNSLERFSLFLSAFTFWFSLIKLIQNQLTQNQAQFLAHFIYMIIILVVFVAGFDCWRSFQLRKILGKSLPTLKTDEQVECHILELIKYAQDLSSANNRIHLQGYLGAHILNCQVDVDVCSCNLLANLKSRVSLQNQQKVWYFFILSILSQGLLKFQKSQRLLLLSSFILKERLNRKFTAFYNLCKCQHLNSAIDLDYDVIIIHHRKKIQYQMFKDQENIQTHKNMSVNKYFSFSNLIVQFESKLEQCSDNHIYFWKQLLSKSLDVEKIQELGTSIIREKQQLTQVFSELNALNPNNIQILVLYGQFLINVANDEQKQPKILQRAESLKRNLSQLKYHSEDSKINYGENSDTAIVVVSGNEHELGIVVNLNKHVRAMLGWTRKDLLGNDLELIMPKVFGQTHNRALDQYLSTSEDHFHGKERIAPAFTKEGYMMPCVAMTKVFANLDKGIQIIGFLSPYKDDMETDRTFQYILYRSDTEVVQGISKSCQQMYSIPGSLVYGHPSNSIHQLKLKHIFQSSPEQPDTKQYIKKNFYSLRLNTSKIYEQFPSDIIGYNDYNSLDSHNDRSSKRFGVSLNVLVKVSFVKQYFDVPLVMLLIMNEQTKIWKDEGKYGDNSSDNRKQITIGNNSMGTTFMDEDEQLKHIKQFKSFISEKHSPVSVIIVCSSSLSFIAIVFVLSFLSLWYFKERKVLFSDAVNSVSMSQYSSMILSEEAYYLRKLNLYKTWLATEINATDIIKLSQINLQHLNTNLKQKHFEIQSIKYHIQNMGFNVVQLTKGFELNWTTSSIFSLQSSIEAEMYDFIGKISILLSSDLQQFIFEPFQAAFKRTTTFETFLVSLNTILFDLVNSTVESSHKLFEFFYCQLQQCSPQFQIILGVALATIIISMSIIIPYVVSVNSINNRVLSLFGMIPKPQISNLMMKCSRFLTLHLTEAEPLELEAKCLNPFIEESLLNYQGQASPTQIKSPIPLLRKIAENRRSKLTDSNTQKQNETPNQRKDQFTESSNKNTFRTVIQYSMISMLFTAYFLSDYLLTDNVFFEMQQGLQNVYYYNKRVQQLRQIKTCSIQAILDLQLNPNYSLTIKDVITSLIDSIYENQRVLSLLDTAKLSPQYSKQFRKINKQNVCIKVQQYMESFNIPLLLGGVSSDECSQTENGLFQKGIQTVVISRLQEIRQGMINYSMDSTKKKQSLVEVYSKAQNLQKYIQYPILCTLKKLIQSLNVKFEVYRLIGVGKLAGFVAIVALLYVILWLPHLKDLNIKVWRTKGMLNLIPMSIISNTERLKNEFTSGQLERAVR